MSGDDGWWIDLFDAIQRAPDAAAAFNRAQASAERLGFNYCCYGIRVPIAIRAPFTAIFSRYPDGWMDHYNARNYIAEDPTIQPGHYGSGPIVWSDRLFEGAQELWSDANDHGLRIGLAQPCWGTRGTYGLLSLARSRDDIADAELSFLGPRLRWLAACVHQRMELESASHLAQELNIALSPRERDILSWTADGKTSWEISQILGISTSTVNFHVKNAIEKLQVRNKVQAAVKATALGLLFPCV